MHTVVLQGEGREAAGSLHAGHSSRSGMTKCVPLQPATLEPPSMDPAVSSHAEPPVAAAGPETPEQGLDISAPASANGELHACVARLPSLVASHASGSRCCTGM